MELLDGLQCERAQGYLFSRPLDAEGAEALLVALAGKSVRAV
jgi:EAL domain-containing protein (putative c-di-GMP-specific phosphodiesterase class I)